MNKVVVNITLGAISAIGIMAYVLAISLIVAMFLCDISPVCAM